MNDANVKQLAELIHGRKYPFELTKNERDAAKDFGLVVCYGDSDDLLEFEGALQEEFSCFGGMTAILNDKGFIVNKCDDEDCPYYAEMLKGPKVEIEAVWCGGRGDDRRHDGEPPWTIKTDIPHETFDIMEDDEVQSRGIVFSMENLAATYQRKVNQ